MLDEDEYPSIAEVHRNCLQATKAFREREGVSLQHPGVQERMRPVSLRYEELTGFWESNPNAIMHHRLSLYGPPCERCGKPLRTPRAKLCGACMFPVGRH